MGLASGATPSSSPNTNSSYDEADYISLPPAIARTLSFRSVSRTPRNSSQFPFPYVVDMQAGNVYQESTATVNRTSSLATIRQSMAYLQSFDDPPLTPGGVNWMLQQQQQQLQLQQQQQQQQPQPGQDGYVGTPVVELPGPIFNRGFSLAGVTPISTQPAAKPEDTQNPSLSRESSRSSGKSPGSVGSVGSVTERPERPERPPTNRQPSQATITQASFNASAATRDHTHPSPPPLIRKESQTTIKLHSVPEDTYSPSIPSATTPDEPHLHIPPSPHAHRAHHQHHHHHHNNHQPKSSIYDTTGSSFSWSTASHEPDPRYDRLLFDYRVIAQSMHAYRHISIFRRFGRLSMANLLYYQDELTCIERALSHVDMEETRWAQTGVSESDSEKQELRETRIKLMKMLQDKLKSYYEALLLQEQIFTSLDPPRPIDSRLLAALEDPSSSPSDSNPFTGAPNSDDLVALGLGGRDSLEKLVGRLVPALFPHRNPSVEDVRHRNLSQKDMASILSPFTRRITRLIIALATTALMLGPMVILQFVTSATWKLVCISLFTVVLALLVALATRGRGEAIVMVVAAYAAVLVVFVQGNQGCGGVVPTIGAGGAGGAGGG